MADFDDRWVDVEFDKDPNFVFGDLGAPDDGLFGSYEDKFGVMSEAEVREAVEKAMAEQSTMRNLVTRIFDQGPEGSCVANALAQAHEICQAEQLGRDKVVHLSAISLYKRIGSSPKSGANIGNGGKEIKARGILPLNNAENKERFQHTMPNTGFYEQYPKGWEGTASKFCVDEMYIVKTIEGLRTAQANNDPCVVGRRGHSICYAGVELDRGKFVYPYPNSWRVTWGDGGWGRDSEAYAIDASDYVVAIRTTRIVQGRP